MPEQASICAREGCSRYARMDEFCSSYCFRVLNDTLGYAAPSKKEERNRKRRVQYLKNKIGPVLEVENTDAMTRLLPGSFESGKRR